MITKKRSPTGHGKFNLQTFYSILQMLESILCTFLGLKLQMLGVTKAKLFPLVKPHLLNLKASIVPLVRKKFLFLLHMSVKMHF